VIVRHEAGGGAPVRAPQEHNHVGQDVRVGFVALGTGGAMPIPVAGHLPRVDPVDAAAAMIAYVDEITAHAAELGAPGAAAALGWASWIRQHAELTNPLNGPLHVLEVTSCSHEELQPHMNGWSTHGPYRH
jgi:hypothetical protein